MVATSRMVCPETSFIALPHPGVPDDSPFRVRGNCAASRPPPYCPAMTRALSVRMLIGLALGLVLGVAAHVLFGGSPALEGFVKNVTEPAGKIFLRLRSEER